MTWFVKKLVALRFPCGFATEIGLLTKRSHFRNFRNFAPLPCYAPLPPFSSRFNSSFFVAKPPHQAHFQIYEPSFAEKSIFVKSVSSPVTCLVQLAPKPVAVFDRSVARLRIPAPHWTKPQLSSNFHWNSICCGFVPRAAQFLHTEFHCFQLSCLLLMRRECANAPHHCQGPAHLRSSSLRSENNRSEPRQETLMLPS